MEKYFQQPTSNQHDFSVVPAAEIERSRFDRSHGHKTTFDAGEIIPIYVDEVLPGDTFTMHSTAFCRLSTPLKPIMDNIYLDTHYFFVPYRLVWDHWENFCGQRDAPADDPTTLRVPQANFSTEDIATWTIAHHMGIPRTSVPGLLQVSALPFRAYALIWNEWYRDQNVMNPITFATDDADSGMWDTFAVQHRSKKHDYFTSCLPWPQKGNPVFVPLGTTAPVVSSGSAVTFHTGAYPTPVNMTTAQISTSNAMAHSGVAQTAGTRNVIWDNTGMQADLTSATAITINDLRTAFQVQRLLERDARGGTRYIELVLSHFGVVSEDLRPTRPVYLGGGTTNVNINPIAQTLHIAGEEGMPLGALAAFGTATGRAGFSKGFTEHGVIIGLMSARAELTYQQGVERFWTRRTRYDFYWPALAHLGEQAVLNREIYFQGGITADSQVFGYQERYAEYRYKPSRITGEFASSVATPLDVWHVAEDFGSLPVLNQAFLTATPPIDRVIAVPSEPHFMCDVWFNLQCQRPMPVYSVPGLVDHF